jgi:glycosidase
MQWDASANAGFTSGTPWLKVPPSARTRNVAAQASDPSSILSFYQRMIALRRKSPALLDGDYMAVGTDPHVYAYLRRAPGQTMLVALNMSAESRTLSLDEAIAGDASGISLRLSNQPRATQRIDGRRLQLAPFESVVLEIRTR